MALSRFRICVSRFAVLSILIVGASATITAQTKPPAPATAAIPLVFEENKGQAPSEFKFLARRNGMEALYSAEGIDIFVPQSRTKMERLRLRWSGLTTANVLLGDEVLPGRSNYFLGSDSSKWLRGIRQFARIRYAQICPGIDVLFYGNGNDIEHDFIVAPGANPSQIGLRFDGRPRLTDSGDLEIKMGGATVHFQKPVAYQITANARQSVTANYSIDQNGQVKFEIGEYDHSRPLVIDPVLTFSTYLAGTGNDQTTAVTTDPAGNVYVTGSTTSPDFPIASGQTAPTGSPEAYVSKLDPTGHTLLYTTFFGGTTFAQSTAIAVDTNLNVIVAGVSSTGFPTAGAVNSPTCQVNHSCYFLISFKSNGSTLNYSGLIGGSNGSTILGKEVQLALDSSGNAYLSGLTNDPNFQLTAGTLGPTIGGFPFNSTFVLKADTTGKLIYSTAIPGILPLNAAAEFTDLFYPNGIVVDANGQATIAGTAGLGLPTTTGVIQTTFPNASVNVEDPSAGFLLQLNATASVLNFATYLPGTDRGGALAVDAQGNFIVGGSTGETTLPVTSNAFQKTQIPTGSCICTSGFIMKVDGQGKTVVAATYLGDAFTSFTGAATDSKSNIFVGGSTNTADFPLKNPIVTAFETSTNSSALVLAQLSPDMSSLLFGSYLSSASPGAGSQFNGLAIDAQDNAIVIGDTFATDFPTTPGSFQPTLPPPNPGPPFETFPHGFVSKLNLAAPVPAACFSSTSITFAKTLPQMAVSQTLVVTNCGNAPLQIISVSSSLPVVVPTQSCGSIAPGNTCNVLLTFTPIDTTVSNGTITIISNASVSQQVIPFTGKGGAPHITFPTSIGAGDLLVGTHAEFLTGFVNTGDGAWIVSSATATGDFTVDNQCTAPLPPPPGQLPVSFCTIGVVFMPTQSGNRTGTLTITDNAVGSPHRIPLTGNGIVTYPAPTITAILGVPTDSSSKELTIIGTNFFPGSQVIVNGTTRPTQFLNEQEISASLTAADLAQTGEVPVTVSNSFPGGGLSNTFLAPIYAAIRNLKILHGVFEPHSGLLYASVSATSANNANQVVVIDPASAQIIHSLSIGNGPNQLAVSDDGQFLYVGLDTDMKVAQVSLPTGTVNFTVGLGLDANFHNPMVADSLRVLPGNPHAWAVTLCTALGFPCGQGMAVFDDAVERPTLANSAPQIQPDVLVFVGSDATNIYGTTLNVSPPTLYKFGVASTGITLTQSVTNFSPPSIGGGPLDSDGTQIYVSFGQIINPVNLAITGNISGTPQTATAFRVDSAASRIYFGGGNPTFFQGAPLSSYIIDAFDLTSQALKGSLLLNEQAVAGDMARWGANGLVINSQSGALILRSSLVGNAPIAEPFEVFGWAPQTVQAGAPGFSLTITGNGIGSGDTVSINGTQLAVVSATTGQIVVTVPASLAATAANLQVNITSPSSATTSLVIAVTPGPTPSVSLSANSLTFASFAVSAPSPSQTLTISNSGAGALVVSNIAASGDFSQTNNCSSVAANGSCTVTVIFTPKAAGTRAGVLTIIDNDASATQTVNLSGTGMDFTPTGPANPVTVTAGQPANFIISAAPAVGGFPNPITFSATGLPSLAAASFSPATLTPGGSSSITTLTITTTARGSTLPSIRRTPWQMPPSFVWTLSCVLAFFGLIFARFGSRRSRVARLAPVLALLAIAISAGGCGGGGVTTNPPTNPGTPAGTFTITVTASSGSDTHTTTVTLIVQ